MFVLFSIETSAKICWNSPGNEFILMVIPHPISSSLSFSFFTYFITKALQQTTMKREPAIVTSCYIILKFSMRSAPICSASKYESSKLCLYNADTYRNTPIWSVILCLMREPSALQGWYCSRLWPLAYLSIAILDAQLRPPKIKKKTHYLTQIHLQN
jgi:hypothetical protein